ncbi:MAG: hypothetical protein MUO77_21210, partial [Anaerolineales bacterium]|nr:hypothetical protein [Anaerolineales bacterium]
QREFSEWANAANFIKTIGEIRQIRAIRVRKWLDGKLQFDTTYFCTTTQNVYIFTPLNAIPSINCFCAMKKIISSGTMDKNAPAINTVNLPLFFCFSSWSLPYSLQLGCGQKSPVFANRSILLPHQVFAQVYIKLPTL